jgi:hypothetical protein
MAAAAYMLWLVPGQTSAHQNVVGDSVGSDSQLVAFQLAKQVHGFFPVVLSTQQQQRQQQQQQRQRQGAVVVA